MVGPLLRYFVLKLTQEIKMNKTSFQNITFQAAPKVMSKKYLCTFHVLYPLEALVFFPPHYFFLDQSPLFQPVVYKDNCTGNPHAGIFAWNSKKDIKKKKKKSKHKTKKPGKGRRNTSNKQAQHHCSYSNASLLFAFKPWLCLTWF